MSREHDRAMRKLEINPVVECNKIQNRFCPSLFTDFMETTDPRNQSYTEYSNRTMLGTLYYKGIAGLVSMRAMTYEFNNQTVSDNILQFLGEKLIVSIGSEFIENNGEDTKRQKSMSAKELKQDCETKAFKRLAKKIKKRFPRLPMIILGDSIYASETVMNICSKNKWDYLIRYKEGSIPSINEEYEAIPEKEQIGHVEYVNDIDYRCKELNMMRFWEDKIIKGEVVRTKFQWITSIRITKQNAEKLVGVGRMRWKIENEGFNRQKNWQGDITHACSFNDQALKNHYLMLQISDMIKQLYEWFYLKANDIKKGQKKISSDLLASFGRQLIGEDTNKSDMQSIPKN